MARIVAVRDRVLSARRSDDPQGFLAAGGRQPSTRTLVACVGDSITHGSVSASYVDLLRRRLAPDGFAFVNAGVNGDLAWNVLQRIDAVLACRPDVVTLLIGTNDVNATRDEGSQDYYRGAKALPQRATGEWYLENVAAVLDRLRAGSDARIVVLDIPILGEDLDSAMNRRVDEYNAGLRALCEARGVPCLPLHDGLVALLPPDHRPPPGVSDRMLMVRSAFAHLLLRRSWDDVARSHGLAVLTDHVHLSERGATVVADLIADALEPPTR